MGETRPLGQNLKMLTDKLEHAGKNGNPNEINHIYHVTWDTVHRRLV